MPATVYFRQLSAPWQRLVRLFQSANFGRIEDLEIRSAEPVFSPAPRVLFSVDLGSDEGSRPEYDLGDFALPSQELVNPPDNPGGGAIWVQRFPDNTPVQTATGVGSLYSFQAAFGSPVEAYMQSAHRAMAALLAAAGLPVRLQFGEVLCGSTQTPRAWLSTTPIPPRPSAARCRCFTLPTTIRRSTAMPTRTSCAPG